MLKIDHLAIEVTRRCNIQCKHCIRGYSENKNIPLRYIDMFLDRVEYIDHFCPTGGEPSLNLPAIDYFINGCKKRNIRIGKFYISTNGIHITEDFIDTCLNLYDMSENKSGCDVQVSNDKYHIKEKKYNDDLLSCLPFYSKRFVENSDMKGTIVWEGLAAKNNIKVAIHNFRSRRNQLYMNVEGDIIDGDCWSYDHQDIHKLCNVRDLTKFHNFLNQYKMYNDKFIEEDFERVPLLDKMYLQERENEIWEEYQQWTEEQDKLPAEIIVIQQEDDNIRRNQQIRISDSNL